MGKNKSDDVLKEYWSEPERFADLFNGACFGGRRVICPEDLQDADSALAVSIPESGTDSGTGSSGTDVYSLTRYPDVVKMVRNQSLLAIVALENQDSIHYAMPVRVMLSNALGYVRQCKSLARQNRSFHSLSTSDEFLSGLKKSDRLMPIVTLVVYYGEEPWDGPHSLRDMFSSEDMAISFANDYPLHLVDARRFSEIVNFHHPEVQSFFEILQVLKSKEKLASFLKKDQHIFLDMETVRAASVAVKSKRLLRILKNSRKDEVIDMCTALEELIAEREAEGEVRGRAEGEMRGVERGRAEGIIKTCLRFKCSEASIREELMEVLCVSEEEAQKYIERFV